MNEKSLAEIAYEAYGNSVGWKNYQGNPMPNWFELPAPINIAWREAAWAVVKENARQEREMIAESGDSNE